MKKKGKFIVLEGADGSGKAIQQKLLIRRIKKELNRKVYKIDFPQYEKTFFGKLVGRYLAGEFGSLKETNPYLSSLTFAGDRWQASEKIRKKLAKSEIVVSNRYALSNMAHQTAKLQRSKRRNFLGFLEKLEYEIYKIPREDINVFLDVPTKIAHKLVGKKSKRGYLKNKKRDIHEKDIEYQTETVEMYKYLARKYKDKIKIVNCCDKYGKLLPVEEIHKMVWNKVASVVQ